MAARHRKHAPPPPYGSVKIHRDDHQAFKTQRKRLGRGSSAMEAVAVARRLLERASDEQLLELLRDVRVRDLQPA